MNDDVRLEILAVAKDLGLTFGGGLCGKVALAIRDVLFDESTQILAVANKSLWDSGRFVGHVGVLEEDGTVWDSSGSYFGEGMEDFRSWGMLDPYDSDYWGDAAASDQEADETVYIKGVTPEWLESNLPCKIGAKSPHEIIQEAKNIVQGEK